MDASTVTTMRGQKVNMNELRLKAKRPMVDMGDQKDKLHKQAQPVRQANIQGFMPSMTGVSRPSVAASEPSVVAEAEPEEQPTMADFTGVIIDTPKHLKERPEDPVASANEALKDIMNDLDQYKGRDAQPDTRTRKSKQT